MGFGPGFPSLRGGQWRAHLPDAGCRRGPAPASPRRYTRKAGRALPTGDRQVCRTESWPLWFPTLSTGAQTHSPGIHRPIYLAPLLSWVSFPQYPTPMALSNSGSVLAPSCLLPALCPSCSLYTQSSVPSWAAMLPFPQHPTPARASPTQKQSQHLPSTGPRSLGGSQNPDFLPAQPSTSAMASSALSRACGVLEGVL